MVALGVIYLLAIIVFFTGIAVSPSNVFRGWPAAISFFSLCASGLALAVHAL